MPRPTRVLFIGNSFTNRNDLPGMLTALGAAAKPPRPIETARVIANGMSLKTHWDRGGAREEVRGGGWDYVVLQEQSTLPLKNRQRMHEYVRRFDGEITAAGAATVLYMTWARRNEFHRQGELSDAYASIGREIGALVAPVGAAWQRAIGEDPKLVLHDRDMSHPNPLGSYLAACVLYSTLFRASPAATTTRVQGLEQTAVDRLRMIRTVAWQIVKEFQKAAGRHEPNKGAAS